MTDSSTVIYTVDARVALITLNRPEKLNAFNRALRMELLAALERAREDDEVRLVVLNGAGRSFCSGADLSEPQMGRTASTRQIINEEYRPIIEAIRDMPKLVIGAVHGAAAGIGSAVVLACDLIVMSEDAYLFEAFADIGLVPDGGVTWFLARAVGIRIATEMMLDPGRIGAGRCLELGLINRICAQDRLLDESLQWAQSLARRAPLPQRHVKALMRDIFDIGLGTAIEREAENQESCSASRDFREGVQAFLEKRKPQFTGE